MELLKGQTIGDYAVLKEIGHGGVGRVYEVEHTITRRREAMKVLAFESQADTEKSERFLREIRLQAALNHPNIAAVHNAFWSDDNFILVSELLEGEPLQAVLARGKLSVERSLEILRQVLAALRCAHSRGIMHRDISPANIFVTSMGSVKLIDFGLAKTSTDLNVTQAGLAVGSFYYTSPEQIRAEPTVDIRTDLYSCGAVLFEMLTGRRLFNGTAFEVMKAHCESAPEPPESIDASISKVVSDVAMKALAKVPDNRFSSADDFLRALELVAAIPAKPTAKVKIGPLVFAGTAVLAVAVGTALFLSQPEAKAVPPIPAPVVDVAPSIADPPSSDVKVEAEVERPKTRRAKPAIQELLPTDESTAQDVQTYEIQPAEAAELAPDPYVRPDEPASSRGVVGAIKKLNPFRKRKP